MAMMDSHGGAIPPLSEMRMAKNEELDRMESELQLLSDRANLNASKYLPESELVINLMEWLTVKNYAEQYRLSIQVVTNWINRGIIPENCIKVIPEFNDLRLVKNQHYKQ